MSGAVTAGTPAQRADANRTVLAALIVTVVMLFSAFAAAYLERRGAQAEWRRIPLPGLIWFNTAVLLLSSVAVEVARRTGRRGWMAVTVALGFVFLAGQIAVWFQLRGDGVTLSSSAYGAFVYVLSGLHAVHLLGGLSALAASARRPGILGLAAGFWHVMGGLWFYILMVLLLL